MVALLPRRTGKWLGALTIAWAILAWSAPAHAVSPPADPHQKPGATDHKAGPAHEDHGHEPGHAEGHDEHGHGHKPIVRGKPHGQYFGEGTEFMYVDVVLLAWTLGVFLILWLILNQLAWKPILSSLEEREKKIAESHRLAEEARKQAEQLATLHDEEMAKAHEQATQLLEQARADASREVEAILNEARQKAMATQASAIKEIAGAKQDAMQQVRVAAAGLAAQMASSLADQPFSPEDCRALVEEVS